MFLQRLLSYTIPRTIYDIFTLCILDYKDDSELWQNSYIWCCLSQKDSPPNKLACLLMPGPVSRQWASKELSGMYNLQPLVSLNAKNIQNTCQPSTQECTLCWTMPTKLDKHRYISYQNSRLSANHLYFCGFLLILSGINRCYQIIDFQRRMPGTILEENLRVTIC